MDVGPFQFFEVNFEDFCGGLSGGGGILPESTKFKENYGFTDFVDHDYLIEAQKPQQKMIKP